ncbi:MAG: histidine kinase [Bacteroidota bacterium]
MRRNLALLTLLCIVVMNLVPVPIFTFMGERFDAPSGILLEPAKYAFGIWYLIYVSFLALGIYQVLPRNWSDPHFLKIRPWLIGLSLVNISWLVAVAFNYMGLTVLFACANLYFTYKIADLIHLGNPPRDWQERLFLKLPIALYFGWIAFLTPINMVSFLQDMLNRGERVFLNTEEGALLMLVGAFFVILWLFLRKKVNFAFILVVIWGLIAVFIANLSFSSRVAFTAFGLAVGLLMAYLIIEKQRVELAKVQMELTALRNQVNPHFLFNNLNTLANLIPLESRKAHSYLDKLAQFYRYIVSQREEHLIPLEEELLGVQFYIDILRERFGEELSVDIEVAQADRKTLLPLSLQMLVENAVKHNEISSHQPLHIRISLSGDQQHLQVENNVNERLHVLASTGMGLDNIRQRYRYYTRQKVEVDAQPERFCVSLPLIEN